MGMRSWRRGSEGNSIYKPSSRIKSGMSVLDSRTRGVGTGGVGKPHDDAGLVERELLTGIVSLIMASH